MLLAVTVEMPDPSPIRWEHKSYETTRIFFSLLLYDWGQGGTVDLIKYQRCLRHALGNDSKNIVYSMLLALKERRHIYCMVRTLIIKTTTTVFSMLLKLTVLKHDISSPR